MAQQTLQTLVVISGRVDNSFGRIGSQLLAFGSQIDVLSDKIINFGKESVKTYADYEQNLLDAKGALSSQYTDTAELEQIMAGLDDSAQHWAATTRFHTSDVSEAISEAAHAGWSYEEMLTGIPGAMELAQAGNLELSQGLDYLIKATNATKTPLSDMGVFIDQWAMAANSSATNIGEMGDAMLKMGSTMQFADSSAELFTMLAVMADMGTVGSAAGTLVRNSMLRLIAPTEKAQEAMDALDVSAEELAELEGDNEALTAANKLLSDKGFSAYDKTTGELKSFLEIYKELYAITSGMSEEDQNTILSAIFPTRTLTGAKNLLEAASRDYDGLYEKIQNSEGYAAQVAEIQMSGVSGSLAILDSKWEELQRTFGERLAPQVISVSEGLGDIITSISEMDETKFGILTAGLEGVAALGPALLVAGGAMRVIGYMATPVGLTTTALVAAGTAMGVMYQMAHDDFWGKFGEMDLDTESISAYLQGLGSDFDTAYTSVNSFNGALETAMENYTTASSTFSSTLLTSSLTELTQEDIDKLEGLGDQMYKSILDGINNNYAADMSTINNAYGGLENAEGNTTWAHIIEVLNLGYESAISQAEELSQRLRNAMTSAFADGKLTGEEVSDIMAIIEEQNELMAMQTNAENYAAQQRMLHKAQTAGLDSLQEISELEAQRQSEVMENLYANQADAYGTLAAQLDYEVEHGTVLEDGTVVTREYADQLLADLKQRQEAEAAGYHLQFAPFTMGLYDQIIGSSDLSGTWGGLGEFAESYLSKGTVTQSDLDTYLKTYSESERLQVADLTGWYVDAMGGVEEITRDIDTLLTTEGKTAQQQAEDVETAHSLMRLLAMNDLSRLSGYGNTVTESEQTSAYAAASNYSVEDARAQAQAIDESTSGMMGALMDSLGVAIETGLTYDFDNLMSGSVTDTGFQTGLDDIVSKLGEVYDLSAVEIPKGLESIRDYAAAYQLLYGNINPEDYRIGAERPAPQQEEVSHDLELTPHVDQGALNSELASAQEGHDLELTPHVDQGALDGELASAQEGHDLELPVTPKVESAYMPSPEELESIYGPLDAPMTVTGAAESATTAHTTAQSTLTALGNLTSPVTVPNADSAAASARGAMAARFSTPLTQYVNIVQRGGVSGGSVRGYAEGGRADEPSIFGEAGAEWAIPEAHTERTAELLNAAREASGFTWPELIERNGGLNAGGGSDNRTLIYQPTIIANDATGVEQKLIEDKARLEKWWNEKSLRDEVEEYA